MLGLKGSFIGFSFDGQHSSQLGISRVFNNDRFQLNLTPAKKDSTAEVPGSDGFLYFGEQNSAREIVVSFAFCDLTEDQLKQLKHLFNKKGLYSLILDEDPYKIWMARPVNLITFKNLSRAVNEKRFYSGEGEITFRCPYGYARSRYQFREDFVIDKIQEWVDQENNSHLSNLDLSGDTIIQPAKLLYPLTENEEFWGRILGNQEDFLVWLEEEHLLTEVESDLVGVNSVLDVFGDTTAYENLQEWITASRLPSREEYGSYTNGVYKLYNAGDTDMHYRLMFDMDNITEDVTVICKGQTYTIKKDRLTPRGFDRYIEIDTFRGIIQGCNVDKKPTKNLYNQILDGNLFPLPVGEIDLQINIQPQQLEYNYLYM